MEDKEINSYFSVLYDRICECLCLVISESERRSTIKSWVYRLVDSLQKQVKNSTTTTNLEESFSHFVGKILSIIESLNLTEKAYKANRKLILDEIYSCKDAWIELMKNNSKITSEKTDDKGGN